MRWIALLALICALLGTAVYLRWPAQDEPLPADPPPPADPADPQPATLPPPDGRTPTSNHTPLPRAVPPGAIPGEVVVSLGSADAAATFARRARQAGLRVLDISPKLGRVRLAIAPGQARLLDSILPNGASLDYNLRLSTPSDLPPGYTGLAGFNSPPGAAVGLPPGNNAGTGVKIAMLDTGVSPHSALASARISQIDLVGTPGYGTHGTAIASILVGTGEVQGIAPGADLLSVRVLDAEGQGDSFTVADGIVQAVDWGADIITLSAGTYGDSDALRAAIAYAEAAGAVVVAAGGNDATDLPLNPAAYDNVIGVVSTDALGNPAPYGNNGPNADIAAPGVDIPAANAEGGTMTITGTSASTPVVAGVLAVALATDPARNAQDTADLMLSTADDAYTAGPDAYLGAGIVSADRLLRADTPGVQDMSVNDFYVSSFDTTTATLNVLVQNRGTANSTPTELSIVAGGDAYTVALESLPAGGVAISSFEISLETLLGGGSLQISATLPATGTDVSPDNNERTRILRRATPPE